MINMNTSNIKSIKNSIHPICKKYNIEHMYLFGSHARGEATAESDYDFFLDKAGDIKSLFTLSGFRLALIECLGKDVDIITALDDNSIFGNYVKKDMVTIYENR